MTIKRKAPQPLTGLKAPQRKPLVDSSVPRETPPDKASPKAEAALHYLKMGWALLPLKGKEPYTDLLPLDRTGAPSWKLLAIQPAVADEVLGWIEHDPNVNLGVILGEPSGWLNVVDVDRPLTGPLHLPPTVQAITARGVHLYYQSDKPLRTRKCVWGEFRSQGSYVVLPPSTHPSGIAYTWAGFCSPTEHEVAELPPDLLDSIEREQAETAAALGHRGSKTNICLAHPPADSVTAVVDLVEWVCREDAAFALMRLCGVDVQKIGAGFRCPLPGHTERKASAALWRQEDGTIGFHDFHMKSGPAWFSLAEVYASCKVGRVMKLGPGEKAAWLLRGLVEAGLMKAPRILAPRLPADAKPVVKAVFGGFQLLLAMRALYNPDQDAAPFSWRFASAWCGKGERHVGEAMKWLLAQGYLRNAKAADADARKWTAALFTIGTPREGDNTCG